MARLIPDHVTKPARTPMSEWEVITGLQSDRSASKTWTVLHSLEIRRHVTKLEGEADLLVLAPGLGVMVVEVKGCDVSRRNGEWTYHYSPPKTSTEGPFGQARTAMHSIRKWLENKGHSKDWLKESGLENWRKWAWHSCVVFTSLDNFSERPYDQGHGPEWTPAEVVTRSYIGRYGIAEALAHALKTRRAELAQMKRDGVAGAAWYDDERSRPTAKEIEALVNKLRPDFHYEGAALANIQRLERFISDATETQAAIASSLLDNQRLVLKGAAGTGKTYVAIRLARYFAETGLRVGFLCFNNLLGTWLRRELADAVGQTGYVGTLSRLMLDILGECVPRDPAPAFWEKLATRTQKHLLEQDAEPKFDVLIVDEAQDLLREDMVDVLDLLLKDGLKQGRWIFAGDFSGQAIFSSGANEEQLLARLARKGIAQANFTLDVNCRNALRVTENIRILTDPHVGYRSCLHSELEGEFKPHFVTDDVAAKCKKLKGLLSSLRKCFGWDQIVVLSPATRSTAATVAALEPDLCLRELKGPSPDAGTSGYATIHAFKGLDAPAVILTDITDLGDALFYTGISRGRQEVHVLLDERMKELYAARIIR
jgi:hypothetical protein